MALNSDGATLSTKGQMQQTLTRATVVFNQMGFLTHIKGAKIKA
jgi:hypothetical protein